VRPATRRALATLGLVLAVGVVGPPLLLRAGDGRRDAADAGTLPQARREGWTRARELYRMAGALPWARHEARQREDELDARLARDFELQRQGLAEGLPGAEAHLAWLQARAQQAQPTQGEQAPAQQAPAEHARQDLLQARVSYGRLGPALELASGMQGPWPDTWAGMAALWQGQLAQVPSSLMQSLPALALAGDGALTSSELTRTPLWRLVSAEHSLRAGRRAEARALLLPLLDANDDMSAAAAATWAATLLGDLQALAEGTMLVGTEGNLEPGSVDTLRASLQHAPSGDPAWLDAWLGLAEVDFRRAAAAEARADALDDAWAAVDLALPLVVPSPAELPARLWPGAPGSVHPRHAQRVRVELGEARVAAAAASHPVPELRDAEATLLMLEARAWLQVDDPTSALGRLDRAAELVPDSPAITAWRVLAHLQSQDVQGARDALAALPELPETTDDEALRAAAQAWLDAPPPPADPSPAAALRARLAAPWWLPPVLAQAQADLDGGSSLAELSLALDAPPDDTVRLPQALAQAALAVRVAGRAGDAAAQARAQAREDALRRLFLDEPDWSLITHGAYELAGPPPPYRDPDLPPPPVGAPPAGPPPAGPPPAGPPPQMPR